MLCIGSLGAGMKVRAWSPRPCLDRGREGKRGRDADVAVWPMGFLVADRLGCGNQVVWLHVADIEVLAKLALVSSG